MEVRVLKRAINYLQLATAYLCFNLKAQSSYRGAFISQMAAMFFNNCCWLLYWSMFFHMFPVVRGWTNADVVTMWAVVAAGFGIGHALCGNALSLPTLIAKGQLDVWMLYPRALLSHLILGRTSATAFGDALFGYFAYIAFAHPDWQHFTLFVFLTLSVAAAFVAFSIMTGSLGFYMGNAEGVCEQWRFALVTFSTYPAELFGGLAKVFLYTVVPAAVVSYLPVQSLRAMSWCDAVAAFTGSLVMVVVAIAVFYHGLSKYESGNLMEMRG